MAKRTAVDDDQLLSISEAARMYGKPRSTFSRWVIEGLVPSVRMPTGLRCVWKSTMLDLIRIAKQAKPAPKEAETDRQFAETA